MGSMTNNDNNDIANKTRGDHTRMLMDPENTMMKENPFNSKLGQTMLNQTNTNNMLGANISTNLGANQNTLLQKENPFNTKLGETAILNETTNNVNQSMINKNDMSVL